MAANYQSAAAAFAQDQELKAMFARLRDPALRLEES